jgi:tetratricopeptide (TPR) repeat protein
MMALLAGLLAVCLLAGCAEEFGGAAVSQPAPPPFVRAEHACAALTSGKADLASVKSDLAGLLGFVKEGIAVRYYKPHDASKAHMWELLAGSKNLYSITHPNDQVEYVMVATIQVSDTRVAVSDRMYFDFVELEDHAVNLGERKEVTGNWDHRYDVIVQGVMQFSFKNPEFAQCVAEELKFIQHNLGKARQDELLNSFQPLVEQYRAMPTKPQVTEEQRKYIVQANIMTQKKEFAKAIEFYAKALEVNPFSFPAAYYNMALISAQQGRYSAAVTSMKKYLLLVPEAEDARAAQDKIYEWEALSGVQ